MQGKSLSLIILIVLSVYVNASSSSYCPKCSDNLNKSQCDYKGKECTWANNECSFVACKDQPTGTCGSDGNQRTGGTFCYLDKDMKCAEFSGCSDFVLASYTDVTCPGDCKASTDAKSCTGSLSESVSCSAKAKDKCDGNDGSNVFSLCVVKEETCTSFDLAKSCSGYDEAISCSMTGRCQFKDKACVALTCKDLSSMVCRNFVASLSPYSIQGCSWDDTAKACGDKDISKFAEEDCNNVSSYTYDAAGKTCGVCKSVSAASYSKTMFVSITMVLAFMMIQ